MVSTALDGIGITYIDEDYLASIIAYDRSVRVPEDAVLPTTDGFFLYYPSRRLNSGPSGAVIDFSSRQFAHPNVAPGLTGPAGGSSAYCL